METSTLSCSPMTTKVDRRWPYQQYYLGEEDQEQRKSGQGANHWNGAESIEWYTGRFIRDTMHGRGEYRWRYKGPEGSFVSYEGRFYGNRMHGCGVMSYPDGRVFNGIFYNNVRWGPGIECNLRLQENVGLWHGNQLVRLPWQPQSPNVTPDFNLLPNATACVERHRTFLTARVQTTGEVNSAIELLKQSGATPLCASEKWTKLYPRHCTDLASQVCHIETFDQEYYKKKKYDLEEVQTMPEDASHNNLDDFPNAGTYYAWNNTKMVISMMKHCFKHEEQILSSGINLKTILTGPRGQYKYPGKHELECRTLILASYLGNIIKVAQMINVGNVHPDVADSVGNTALMYAACGDHGDIVHFLMEAGANINSFNDSCCTPLGAALMKFACESKDIAAKGMVQSFIPPDIPSKPITLEPKPSEWHITRNCTVQNDNKIITKAGKAEKKKSSIYSMNIKTLDNVALAEDDLIDKLSEEHQVFESINAEFLFKVKTLFSRSNELNRYLFEVTDMAKDLDVKEEDKKTNTKKKLSISKATKEITKPSKDILWKISEKDINSLSSADRAKMEMLSRSMSTVVQLLKDGADPRLVRCPQPALRIAAASGSPELVRHLVQYQADINEVYPEVLNYTVLDMAISQPLTYENLDLIRALLECGARTDHRLEYHPETIHPTIPDVPGPTLLHVVLGKDTDEAGEEIQRQLVELLLEYNCNALTQFKGRSAMDAAMMEKMDLFDIFVKCPKTDLNTAINDSNQTVLVKMFSWQFFKGIPLPQLLATLTNLLLYGADPLLECQDADNKYTNIFVYAMKNFLDMGGTIGKQNDTEVQSNKPPTKGKSKTKSQSSKEKLVRQKSLSGINDYRQAINLVTECVRILHVRWIQAQLLKELIQVVEKFEHRRWNIILPEYKNKEACGLWLTYPRAFEIWEIFKTARKKKVTDRRVLKHVLCIVHFNSNRSMTSFKRLLTAEENGLIETNVACFLQEQKIQKVKTTEQHYVTPELAEGSEKKFQVCFECALPFEEKKIQCVFCKQVSFCSLDCVARSTEEDLGGCHPCSEKLKNKYFPADDDTSVVLSVHSLINNT